MSSFSEAFVNSFGTGASIGTNAAADARRDRLAGELRKQQEGQRAEEKRLAVEIRANQEKKETQGLFFRAMGSKNYREVKAAAAHFGQLASADAMQWGSQANELTGLAAELQGREADQLKIESEQIRQKNEESAAQLDRLKSATRENDERTEYWKTKRQPPFSSSNGHEDGPRTPTPAPDPSQPYFDATARNPDLLPQLEKKYEGVNLTDKQYDDLATIRQLKAAQGETPKVGTGQVAGAKGGGKRSLKTTTAADGTRTQEETITSDYDGTGPSGGGAPAVQPGPFVPYERDRAAHKELMASVDEMADGLGKKGFFGAKVTPEEVEKAGPKLKEDFNRIYENAKRFATKEERPGIEAAAKAEWLHIVHKLSGTIKGEDEKTAPPAPNEKTPAPTTTSPKPALLPAAEKLRTANPAEEEPKKRPPPVASAQPAPSTLDQAREMVRKADEAEKAKAHAIMVRGGEDAREVAKNIFWDTPKALLKDAASGAKTATAELTKFLDAQEIVKQRRDWRKVLEAQGVKNPSDAMIDEMILKQVQRPR